MPTEGEAGPERTPHVFVVDNYDSFTYNLVQYFGELGAEVTVRRNDQTTPEEIAAAGPSHLVVSPGPCTPDQAGVSVAAIRHLSAFGVPVLGVCLGHQAIGQAFGGVVRRAAAPVHGKPDGIHHDGRGLFEGLPDPFVATRYHSLIVDESLPAELELAAWNDEGVVMGIRHRVLPVHGVQFHPESVLTEVGRDLLRTFVRMQPSPVSGRTTGARPIPGPGPASAPPSTRGPAPSAAPCGPRIPGPPRPKEDDRAQ